MNIKGFYQIRELKINYKENKLFFHIKNSINQSKKNYVNFKIISFFGDNQHKNFILHLRMILFMIIHSFKNIPFMNANGIHNLKMSGMRFFFL